MIQIQLLVDDDRDNEGEICVSGSGGATNLGRFKDQGAGFYTIT